MFSRGSIRFIVLPRSRMFSKVPSTKFFTSSVFSTFLTSPHRLSYLLVCLPNNVTMLRVSRAAPVADMLIHAARAEFTGATWHFESVRRPSYCEGYGLPDASRLRHRAACCCRSCRRLRLARFLLGRTAVHLQTDCNRSSALTFIDASFLNPRD